MTRGQLAVGIVALAVAAGGGFLAGAQRGEAPQTRLSLATCGLVPAPVPLDLPLDALMSSAATPGLTLGPILHPGLETPLSIHFQPLEAGAEPRPLKAGQTLELPVDTARLPDEVRLSCRHGAVARVEYRHGTERLSVEVAQPEPASPAVVSDAEATTDRMRAAASGG